MFGVRVLALRQSRTDCKSLGCRRLGTTCVKQLSDCGSAHKSIETPFELAMPILNVRLRVGYKDKQNKAKDKKTKKTTAAKHVVASDVDTDDLSKDEDNDDESSESASSPPPKKTSRKHFVSKKPAGVSKKPTQKTPPACCMCHENNRNRFIVRIKGEPSRLFTYGHDGSSEACKKQALAYIRNFFVERGFPLPPRCSS